MSIKLPLKNSSNIIFIDNHVFDFINSDLELSRIQFLNNLRQHSAGYAFFQKHWPIESGGYKCQTIYLHKIIAEKFIPKPETDKRLFVSFKNSNALDCRLENLEWNTITKLIRNTNKQNNKLGYRGVVKDRGRYRAIIYFEGKPIHVGSYKTIEEAAEAYNLKSIELYGQTKCLNEISSQ